MDLRKLAIVHREAVPLYSLPNGARYRYTDHRTDGCSYTFVKHSEYEFPAHFRLNKKNIVTYQYKVTIPDSRGHQVIFVDETSIVQLLDFT